MCHVPVKLFQRARHLLPSKASPVPTQHIVHPSGHGLMAVTDNGAAFDFILQPRGKKKKDQLHLWSALRSLSLASIYPKDVL